MKATAPGDMSHEDRLKTVDFLDSHPVGVIATVDSEGNPNASTIYFGVSSDLKITFTTKRDTRKHDNIEQNSKVMLVVYDAETQSAVQISGAAKVEEDSETALKIYEDTLRAAKRTAEDRVPPIAKVAAGPYIAYTVTPDTVSMSEYGWGDSFINAIGHAGEPVDTSDPD